MSEGGGPLVGVRGCHFPAAGTNKLLGKVTSAVPEESEGHISLVRGGGVVPGHLDVTPLGEDLKAHTGSLTAHHVVTDLFSIVVWYKENNRQLLPALALQISRTVMVLPMTYKGLMIVGYGNLALNL